MTAPCESAKKDIGNQQPDQRAGCEFVVKIQATPARQLAVPAAPISSSTLRPAYRSRSFRHGEDQLVKPMAMAFWSPLSWLNPAAAKMSFK